MILLFLPVVETVVKYIKPDISKKIYIYILWHLEKTRKIVTTKILYLWMLVETATCSLLISISCCLLQWLKQTQNRIASCESDKIFTTQEKLQLECSWLNFNLGESFERSIVSWSSDHQRDQGRNALATTTCLHWRNSSGIGAVPSFSLNSLP